MSANVHVICEGLGHRGIGGAGDRDGAMLAVTTADGEGRYEMMAYGESDDLSQIVGTHFFQQGCALGREGDGGGTRAILARRIDHGLRDILLRDAASLECAELLHRYFRLSGRNLCHHAEIQRGGELFGELVSHIRFEDDTDDGTGAVQHGTLGACILLEGVEPSLHGAQCGGRELVFQSGVRKTELVRDASAFYTSREEEQRAENEDEAFHPPSLGANWEQCKRMFDLRQAQNRALPQHFPRQVDTREAAMIIDDAVAQIAVRDFAVVEDNAVADLALLDPTSLPDSDTALADGVDDVGSVGYESLLSHEEAMRGEVGIEGADIEPGFGEGEAAHGDTLPQKFLEDAADVVGMRRRELQQDGNRFFRDDGASCGDERRLRIDRLLLKSFHERCVRRIGDHGSK